MAARNPDDFAVVIGIRTYPQLPPLNAAVSDASRFSRWLIEVGGLDDGHIAFIESPASNDFDSPIPVHRKVTRALQDFGVQTALEKPRRIGRRLYFYFSGHAVGPKFNDISLLMADASTSLLKQNIGLDPYRSFFHDTGFFDEVIFILDCCRDHERNAKAQEPEFSTPPPPIPVQATNDFVVMAAPWGSKAFQAPIAGGPRRSGLLTEALLEGIGLDGPPKAIDPQGRVKTNILSAYLKARVPQLAQAAEIEQAPEATAKSPDEPIVLATFPLDPARAVMLTVRWQPQLPPGTLIVLMKQWDGSLVPADSYETTAAAQSYVIALRPGFFYEVRHRTAALTRLVEVDLSGAAEGGARAIDLA